MKNRRPLILTAWVLLLVTLACQSLNGGPIPPTTAPTPTIEVTPAFTPTPLPPMPVEPGQANPNEPVFVIGDIPYTSPFFLNSLSQPFVMLEDQAGFVQRDREFQFLLASQVIGPVDVQEDSRLAFSLSLPAIPQGTQVDVDNNGQSDKGVQIFAVAYWSNTWGDPFLEERDGSGWSTAYASTITDPENEDEIIGGHLIVWAPDDQQAFPTGFGEDGLLFTDDDPTDLIPAGYNIVDLNEEPFKVYKEARPEFTLHEGEIAVNDFSEMSYPDAFEALFEKASREYPFTTEKELDWEKLHDQFSTRIANAKRPNDFYAAIRDFTYAIPDAHVGLTFNAEVFYEQRGGSFGLVLTELSDGRVLVTHVLPNTQAQRAGIQVGAEIVSWDGQPVSAAISKITPYLGPYSTEHHKRLEQIIFLTRVPPGTNVEIAYKNPGESQEKVSKLKAEVEYDSLFKALPGYEEDEMLLPIQGEVLDGSGLGYIRVATFSDDYSLMARLWEHYIQSSIDHNIPGLIIDLRSNSGGSGGMALDFAGFFFDEEIELYRGSYYNERLGEFEYSKFPARIKPAPLLYEGPIAVLVSPYCVSACEGFAYALSQGGRATVVGHYPTAGAFGEVGRGQYKLPDAISVQFPTGRPETLDGRLLIEGTGVVPDVLVPVTEESALGEVDAVLNAAIEALKK